MSNTDAADLLAQRWRGMKVSAVGATIAGVGFAGLWFFAFKPAVVLFFVGWLIGVAGGVIHVRQMFRESRLKRGDLYPRARQSWEQP